MDGVHHVTHNLILGFYLCWHPYLSVKEDDHTQDIVMHFVTKSIYLHIYEAKPTQSMLFGLFECVAQRLLARHLQL